MISFFLSSGTVNTSQIWFESERTTGSIGKISTIESLSLGFSSGSSSKSGVSFSVFVVSGSF